MSGNPTPLREHPVKTRGPIWPARKYRTHATEQEAWAHINQQVDEFYAELRDPEVPR